MSIDTPSFKTTHSQQVTNSNKKEGVQPYILDPKGVIGGIRYFLYSDDLMSPDLNDDADQEYSHDLASPFSIHSAKHNISIFPQSHTRHLSPHLKQVIDQQQAIRNQKIQSHNHFMDITYHQIDKRMKELDMLLSNCDIPI